MNAVEVGRVYFQALRVDGLAAFPAISVFIVVDPKESGFNQP